MDGQQVIDAIKAEHESLYELMSNAKYSSFRGDDGTFQPRPLYSEDSLILRFRFDDGIQLSVSLIASFPELRQIIYEHAFAVALRPGQSYIVDNHRFLHGRTSFSGSRELLRVLAYPHSTETVKPILFDVDGTLCRAEALSIDAYYRCVSDVTGKHITNENTQVNLHGATDISLLKNILQFHGMNDEQVDTASAKFLKLHPQYLENSLANGFESRACPEVNDVLTWLTTKNREQSATQPKVPVGLLTGNSERNALLKIKAAGIDPEVFDLSISSFGDTQETRLGLVQDSINKASKVYGTSIKAEDVTLIGDTPLDIDSAKQAGCGVVAVGTGNYSTEQLAPWEPDALCETLPQAKQYLTAVMSSWARTTCDNALETISSPSVSAVSMWIRLP